MLQFVTDLETARATVGGADYAVGGWGAYELDRRRERRLATGGGESSYPGRTYIGGDDVVQSVMAAAWGAVGGRQVPAGPLQKASVRLAEALGTMEDRLCDPSGEGVWECVPRVGECAFAVPPVTSADLREFSRDVGQATDPETIRSLFEALTTLAVTLGVDVPEISTPAPLPARFVEMADEEGVARLEAEVAPHVAGLEELQAAAASYFDKLATVVREQFELSPL